MSEGKMSWADLGTVNVDDVEKPRIIPKGHYSAMFTGKPTQKEAKTGTLGYEFIVRLVEPMGDVDADEFGESSGFAKAGYKLNFWLSTNSLYRFTDFVKAMGGTGLAVPDGAEFLANSQDVFVVKVDHEEDSKKLGNFYVRLDDPVPMTEFAS